VFRLAGGWWICETIVVDLSDAHAASPVASLSRKVGPDVRLWSSRSVTPYIRTRTNRPVPGQVSASITKLVGL
jgi:hypothetical protein